MDGSLYPSLFWLYQDPFSEKLSVPDARDDCDKEGMTLRAQLSLPASQGGEADNESEVNLN